MIPTWLNDLFLTLSHQVMRLLPYATPSVDNVTSAKIIAHRGIFDNQNVIENTLPAFEPCLQQHIWGIECDLQWTKDNEPVLSHDADLRRLFAKNVLISDLTLTELKQLAPQIPSLSEVVAKFGKRLHLMLELKVIPKPQQPAAIKRLVEVLSPLKPVTDYHLLAFNTELLDRCRATSPKALIPIADINASKLLAEIVAKDYGGIAGHFLLIRQSIIQQCRAQQLTVGTGLIDSIPCLKRELNRGVEWIFTNQAGIIHDYCQQLRQA